MIGITTWTFQASVAQGAQMLRLGRLHPGRAIRLAMLAQVAATIGNDECGRLLSAARTGSPGPCERRGRSPDVLFR